LLCRSAVGLIYTFVASLRGAQRRSNLDRLSTTGTRLLRGACRAVTSQSQRVGEISSRAARLRPVVS